MFSLKHLGILPQVKRSVAAAALAAAGSAGAQSVYPTPFTISTPVSIYAPANSDNGLGLFAPAGVAVDGSGDIYIADTGHSIIRKFSTAAYLSTVAGTLSGTGSADGSGTAASFNGPNGLAIDGSGNLYVADTLNQTIRKITPSGTVTTLAGSALVAGSADGAGSAARFSFPYAVTIDTGGNLYVTDQQNDTIRKITPSGMVTTLAGAPGEKGDVDGAGAAARFDRPCGIAVDPDGNLFVADSTNEQIRKVTPSGVVTTLAGKAGTAGSADGTGAAALFFFPTGIVIGASGNLFVSDSYNNTLREVTQSGVVSTIAGTSGVSGADDGTGAAARFNNPQGMAIDGSGSLFIADTNNGSIRKGYFSGIPEIDTGPTDLFVAAGSGAVFSVTASGNAPLSYQWDLNGVAIPGATGASYTIAAAQASDGGSYTVTVSNGAGSATSGAASLSVNTSGSTARLVNISTRAQVGTGGNILIPGFVIAGSGLETLLIRADGPALSQFAVSGVLAQPVLSLLDSQGNTIASNTSWGTSADPSQVASAASSVGAFPLAPGSADCALIASLPAGAYTVQVSGVNYSTGVALAEIYEISSTGTRLANISTRAQVGTGGNIIIPGFVVAGTGSEQLLVRGDGPALAQFNVQGILSLPSLGVFDSAGHAIASNTGWGSSPSPSELATVARAVGAFALSEGSADSAEIVTLPAGAYTAQVSGANGTAGIALAEIYEIP